MKIQNLWSPSRYLGSSGPSYSATSTATQEVKKREAERVRGKESKKGGKRSNSAAASFVLISQSSPVTISSSAAEQHRKAAVRQPLPVQTTKTTAQSSSQTAASLFPRCRRATQTQSANISPSSSCSPPPAPTEPALQSGNRRILSYTDFELDESSHTNTAVATSPVARSFATQLELQSERQSSHLHSVTENGIRDSQVGAHYIQAYSPEVTPTTGNQNGSPVKSGHRLFCSADSSTETVDSRQSLDSQSSSATDRLPRTSSFRRSLPTGLVVSNIAPCFARLKQIVNSVRRSRSSSARMSVSGTKRKSSPPSFSTGASGSSPTSGTSGSSTATEDHDDSPANPTKMRRRQSSQPSTTQNLATLSSASLASVLSKYFDYASTSSSSVSSNSHQQFASHSKSKSMDPYPANVLYSRLRKNRTKDSSMVTAIPFSDIEKKEFELPYKLRVQLDQPPILHEEQLKHSWNDQDKSLNIVILPHTNSLIFRRYPVAQSTDCIRGKVGFSSGLHVWDIKWPSNQRGTHAVIGVATKDAPLHCSGYKSLIGSNGESWGWDIGRSKLMHDYTNTPPKTYPSHVLDKDEVLVVPEKITVILDMDQGTLAYMIDGQYLGVAFTGLKNVNKPLFPIVSAVWGHCEVEMTYLHAPQEMSLQSMSRYEIRRSLRHMFFQLKLSMCSSSFLDNSNLVSEVNSNNNGNCFSSAALAAAAAISFSPNTLAPCPSLLSQIAAGVSILPPRNNASGASPLNHTHNLNSNSCSSSSSAAHHPLLWSSSSNPLPLSASPTLSSTGPPETTPSIKSLSNQFPDSLALAHCLKGTPSASLCVGVGVGGGDLNNGNGGASSSSSSTFADFSLLQQHITSAMSSGPCFMDSFPFALLPPGCSTDSQFIQHHVEQLQIPTCLKHYLT